MKVLISPNAFKHALPAFDVARAIQRGVLKVIPNAECILMPIGDGGDGTGDLLIHHLGAETIPTTSQDPFGNLLDTSFGYLRSEHTAIIEMCYASGIRLVAPDKLNPLYATSYGTGMLMKRSLEEGAKKIILGMGGSATVDGGMGILRALGIKFLDSGGKEIIHPKDLVVLESIDSSGVDRRLLACEVVVLCDVENFLLGKEGAASVFGPQKGATPEMVIALDEGLKKFSEVTYRLTGIDMATISSGGTAGGAASGLFAIINAKLVNGIEYFLDLIKFDVAVKTSDVVITGEGSLDEQTLQGKGPFGVARRAKQKGVKVIGLAGKVYDPENKLKSWFDIIMSINKIQVDLTTALKNTESNLIVAASETILRA
jgi:glycerate kinase